MIKKITTKSLTLPKCSFHGSTPLGSFELTSFAFFIPLDSTVDRLAVLAPNKHLLFLYAGRSWVLGTKVHVSVGYVHWVSTLVVLKVMV